MIKLKRAYEKASKDDGFRILVDRLWPRGMSKEKEHLDSIKKKVGDDFHDLMEYYDKMEKDRYCVLEPLTNSQRIEWNKYLGENNLLLKRFKD